jgi:hypothetical protein
MLELLPNELITHILTMLHFRDLATSIQVRLPFSHPTVTTKLVRS